MIRAAALAALLLGAAPAWAGPRFSQAPGLVPAEQAASARLLEDIAARLPPAWGQALPDPVRLEWRQDLPARVHGRAVGQRVLLDRGLLRQWLQAGQGEAAAAAWRALQAALVHELGHLYDRGPAGGLSADPRLLDLAGWQKAVLRPGRRARNDFRDRSPDPYELAGPREFVAVNLEHYLLDPSYRCQRPALAAYFDARFDQAPPPEAACPQAWPFVQDVADGRAPLLRLDPARVWAVDYLFAEPNRQPMSRWGHSMLRLVVCAPDREPGPDCRLDLSHHLVLSFRAFVDDLQISGWRGLSGGYPSRLFVLPLDQVVEEYTRVELRGLRALPLALERAEIEAVLERAARLHWSYDGRYYFLSNNCAVETWRLLHDAAPRLAALPLASITPSGLLRRLQDAGLADAAQLPASAQDQVRLGLRFESAAAHRDALYAVARAELGLEPGDARQWLALAPAQRRPALERAGLRAAAALLVLETAALRREQALARDQLKRRWLRDPRRLLEQAPGLDQALASLLDLGGAFSRPAGWLEGLDGYGVPQPPQLEQLQDRAAEAGRRRARQAQALEQGLRALLPPARRQALEQVQANLDLVSARLRELAANGNGAPVAPRGG